MTTQFRIEKDSLGEVQVPCDALYGVQTVRATQNFPITHLRTHPAMIRSLGMIKKACAMANHECGHLDAGLSRMSYRVVQEQAPT